jgi:Restriction endonuclease
MPKRPPTIASLKPKQPWSHERTRDERVTYNTVYNTPRWRAIRDMVRQQQPVCVMCKAEATHTVDHIVPIRDGGDAWALHNLQGLCKACNAIKTGRQRSKTKTTR